jgi:hypothetical protein
MKIIFLMPRRTTVAFWTAVAKRSDDTAFARTMILFKNKSPLPHESGVALRFPPQST